VTLGDLNRLAHAVELVLVAQGHEPQGELVAADVHLLPVCLLAVHQREEALDLLVLVPDELSDIPRGRGVIRDTARGRAVSR
jgi:hypothetical protein